MQLEELTSEQLDEIKAINEMGLDIYHPDPLNINPDGFPKLTDILDQKGQDQDIAELLTENGYIIVFDNPGTDNVACLQDTLEGFNRDMQNALLLQRIATGKENIDPEVQIDWDQLK